MYWLLIIISILLVFVLIAVVAWLILTLIFGGIMLFGAPYVGSKRQKLKQMIKLARIKKGDKAADLGSGDGRVVLALAKTGATAHGYEINPVLVWQARRKIAKAGVSDRATIYFKNYWLIDLSSYDLITVYGTTYIMKKLETKLQKELKPGARVISNYFKFPHWQPQQSRGEVHLYIK